MTIAPGRKLGPYEVLSPLGAGGMGEVYKAKDTRLDRSVALKVLPGELSRDPSRRARFEREAKAISQLDHQHICALYDIGAHDGVDFLVMQYLEGETLADRLMRGAFPLEQALELARQMTSALAAAHGHGIVHRDLKPSNVMLTKSGVKLLDFGLAKCEEKAGSVAPTEAKALTQEGALLGTIPYMAPEQLEGKEADARTDIYAFGAVLYEMVTGRRVYDEEQRSALSPKLLQMVVSRALSKAPDDRWQSVRDVGLILENVEGTEATRPAGKTSRVGERVLWASLIALTAVVSWWARPATRGEVVRVTVTLPVGEYLYEDASPPFAVSSDGRRIAYSSRLAQESSPDLFVRDLHSFETRFVSATVPSPVQLAFSPDGEHVAFFSKGYNALYRVPSEGGNAQRICETSSSPQGVAWTKGGEILFGSVVTGKGIYRVDAMGGTPEPMTTLAAGETAHHEPSVLPDGRGILFTADRGGDTDIAVLPVDAKEHRILFAGRNAAYVSSGHLVFARAGSARLFAVPFDVGSLEVRGDPIQLGDVFALPRGWFPQFRIGADGTLVYAPGIDSGSEVVWVDRKGSAETVATSDRRYHTLNLSTDGKRFAADEGGGGANHIWVHDLERGTRTLAVTGDNLQNPRFRPDGTRIAYVTALSDIFLKPADGTGEAEALIDKDRQLTEPAWSPDGSILAFTEVHPDTLRDIWVRLHDGSLQPFLVTPAVETAPAFSPNGKWIAYQSDASGREEIYVQPSPGPGARHLISTNGGKEPVWSRDGRELFYRENTKLISVSVETGDSFRAGVPELLFDGPYQIDTTGHASYDVSADGEKFLMIRNPEGGITELRVVLNFAEELKALVPQ